MFKPWGEKVESTLLEYPKREVLDDPERRQLIANMVYEFKKRVLAVEGENLRKIILYGSVVRYEENEESDIDIFILLEKIDYENQDRISDISTEVSYNMRTDKYRWIPISPFVIGLEEYEKNQKSELLFYVLAEEGVVIYDAYA